MANKENPKEPKGSKLDANNRAEYMPDLAQKESWDASGRSTWVVTGRVLPERCDLNVRPPVSHAVCAGGTLRLKIDVTRSHILAACWSENGSANILEIADAVRTVLAFPVDYIAYQNRVAYEIVLDVCMNTQTGQVSAIPIFEPIFEVADAGLCFDAQADKSILTIPWAEAIKVAELPTVLHDLTSAVRYPRRTLEYCRMAAEMVRAHFDPSTTVENERRWIRGELAMCKALRIKRKSLMELEGRAARSRRGKLFDSIS